jgi:hypothetical protein
VKQFQLASAARIEPVFQADHRYRWFAYPLGIFSPIFVVFAVLVNLTSRGPVFFTQMRVGQRGRRHSVLNGNGRKSGSFEARLGKEDRPYMRGIQPRETVCMN